MSHFRSFQIISTDRNLTGLHFLCRQTATPLVLPLLYQFTLDERYFVHTSLLSSPSLQDVLLPVGGSTITSSVLDARSSQAVETVQSAVTL